MLRVMDAINGFLWGVPALVLILSVGLVLSIRTHWVQLRLFPAAIRAFITPFHKKEKEDGISPYRALCTALAATVGTGNLAGVAGAIAIGGPGAIFWMWISAILGMVTKFAEATLSVRYRVRDSDGQYVGGPMYMVQQGLSAKWRPVACIYCFFGVVAAFGVGSATQVNAVLGGINGAVRSLGGQESSTVNLIIGVALVLLIAPVLLGGAKRIGAAAAFLVPFASVFYLLLCTAVLLLRASEIPQAFSLILQGAFSPKAATGGVLGSAFLALRIGTSRGVFTNEAGMGTAGIAHGSAQVTHPVQQGLMGIIEVFIDTIVICTMTALVILCSGIEIPYGHDLGIRITADAFAKVLGSWVTIPIALSLCCFAIATVIGWGLYGARCAQFLFGDKAWKRFSVLQAASIIIGVVLSTGTVWIMSEIANGLMAIPNLLILLHLCPELVRLTKEYSNGYTQRKVSGVKNENIREIQALSAVSYEKVS
ncbi:MAG: sodium:alanine symporter family protein [Ruminococcaceae bacterium]|nr:sodium:alanine symporter family protein [Oscillospiraceae bacterium]